MKLTEAIEQASENLDEFNLEVARYRAREGMCPALPHLYGVMGRMSKTLQTLQANAVLLEALDREAEALFTALTAREVKTDESDD